MSGRIIALLRGIDPDEALAVAGVLVGAGITRIAVPLCSPAPYESIAAMVRRFGTAAQIGGATVLAPEEVLRLHQIGAGLIVSPDMNQRVIMATKKAGMQSLPGIVTPTEAFTALRTGADGLMLFPAHLAGFAALKAVLPSGTRTYAVGGIDAGTLPGWLGAGVSGFGIGSWIYRPGRSLPEIEARAHEAVAACEAAMAGGAGLR